MAIAVTDEQVAALRAFLMHDVQATTRITSALGNRGITGYQRLADAALSVAVVRRFSPSFTNADLVRYIASVRVSRIADGKEYDFDPAAGENVLRYSLGQVIPRTPDPTERFRAVIALLDALADSELSSEEDVDDLLAEARELAGTWTHSRALRYSQDDEAAPEPGCAGSGPFGGDMAEGSGHDPWSVRP